MATIYIPIYLPGRKAVFRIKLLLIVILSPFLLIAAFATYITAQYWFDKHFHEGTMLSYELEYVNPAPDAPTRQERVWLWVNQRRDLILAAAKKYNISATAIAGVIMWEALEDPDERSLPGYLYFQGLKLEGPGKVHAQDLNPSRNAASFLEGNMRYQPMLPPPDGPWWQPVIVRRVLKLFTSEGSIEYIAAIMNAYATEAERTGYAGDGKYYLEMGIRNKPTILATYFNGAKGAHLPTADKYFKDRMRKRGFAPFKASCFAGTWIRKHWLYVNSALGLAPKRGNPVVESMLWYASQTKWPEYPFFVPFRYVKRDQCQII